MLRGGGGSVHIKPSATRRRRRRVDRPGECGAIATAEVLDAIALRVFHHTSYWRRWTVQ